VHVRLKTAGYQQRFQSCMISPFPLSWRPRFCMTDIYCVSAGEIFPESQIPLNCTCLYPLIPWVVNNNATCVPVCPFPAFYEESYADILSTVSVICSWISFLTIILFALFVLLFDKSRLNFPANLPIFALMGSLLVLILFFVDSSFAILRVTDE
jgi:hypothetical protein